MTFLLFYVLINIFNFEKIKTVWFSVGQWDGVFCPFCWLLLMTAASDGHEIAMVCALESVSKPCVHNVRLVLGSPSHGLFSLSLSSAAQYQFWSLLFSAFFKRLFRFQTLCTIYSPLVLPPSISPALFLTFSWKKVKCLLKKKSCPFSLSLHVPQIWSAAPCQLAANKAVINPLYCVILVTLLWLFP